MKQGALSSLGRAWSAKRFQLICGIFVVALFSIWYWNYGGPWTLEATSARKTPDPTYGINFNQQIYIPKVPGGASSMLPQNVPPNVVSGTDAYDHAGLALGWTLISSGDDGQLLADLAGIRLWRKVERSASFQYIPTTHTIDENRNKPILYELITDSFKCADRTAVKLHLDVKYEDGSWQQYFPWGYAGELNIWKPVMPDTALDREMQFVCAVKLSSDPSSAAIRDADRLFGTWQVEGGALGSIAAAPMEISDTQVAWTMEDKHECALGYHIASRSAGPTFPGGPTDSGRAYTTFVLELKNAHLSPCAQKISHLTISLSLEQPDLAHFAAFWGAVESSGTMHRQSSPKASP